jgi:hypothetical protein
LSLVILLLSFKHKVAETGTWSNESAHALSPRKEDTFIAVTDPNMTTYESENKIHPSAEVIAAHNILECNGQNPFKLS